MDIQRAEDHGSSRTLTVYATFEELLNKLGRPKDVSEETYKVDVEWNFFDADTGRSLHIWNYKNGPNYLGEDGTPVAEIEKWSGDGSKELFEQLGIEAKEPHYR